MPISMKREGYYKPCYVKNNETETNVIDNLTLM